MKKTRGPEAQRPEIPKRPKTHRNPIDEMLSQRGPNPNWTFKYNIRPERPRGLEAQRPKDRKNPEAQNPQRPRDPEPQRPRGPRGLRPKRPIHHQLMFIRNDWDFSRAPDRLFPARLFTHLTHFSQSRSSVTFWWFFCSSYKSWCYLIHPCKHHNKA